MKTNNTYKITNFNEYELYHLKAEIDSLNTELLNSMKYLSIMQPEYYETHDTIETLQKVILLLDELVHLQKD